MVVSVIVPTCGRRALLRRCLGQLVAQDFDPAAYEILVADDDLDPETEGAVMAVRARWPEPPIRYVAVGKGRGPAAAMKILRGLIFTPGPSTWIGVASIRPRSRIGFMMATCPG